MKWWLEIYREDPIFVVFLSVMVAASIGILAIGMPLLVVSAQHEREKACEERGGVPTSGMHIFLCLDPSALK